MSSSKRVTKKSTTTPVEVSPPVVEVASSSANVEVKKKIVKKATVAKTTEIKEEQVVPSTPPSTPVENGVDDTTTTTTTTVTGGDATPSYSFETELDNRIKFLEETRQHLKDEIVQWRTMKKNYMKEKRDLRKNKHRRGEKLAGGSTKKPSGFAQSSQISETLCDFLNIPRGTEIARTDVTKKIIAYIKEHSLEVPENKRIINPDARLESIVGNMSDRLETMTRQFIIKPPKSGSQLEKEGPTGKLGYFNLQVHLNKHFIRSKPKTDTVDAVQVVATA